jgi:hypothetical protein
MKFKEIARERKITNICGNPRASCFRVFCYIFLSYNLVEHYVSPILQKDGTEIVLKGLIMLEDSEFRKLAKETSYVYC